VDMEAYFKSPQFFSQFFRDVTKNKELEQQRTQKQILNVELDLKIAKVAIIKTLKNKNKQFNALFQFIQDVGPGRFDGNMVANSVKEEFVRRICYTVPTRKLITECLSFIGKRDKVLSIGSGKGLLEKLLILKGVDVHATDYCSKDWDFGYSTRFCNVEKLNAIRALHKYSKVPVLFMSWPEQTSEMASEALRMFEGNKFIYIGETKGGSVGTDKFFDLLSAEWDLVKWLELSHFVTCARTQNTCQFFERKGAKAQKHAQCAFCSSYAESCETENLLRCSRCHTVRYCNKTCQRKHWKEHRKYCDSYLNKNTINF